MPPPASPAGSVFSESDAAQTPGSADRARIGSESSPETAAVGLVPGPPPFVPAAAGAGAPFSLFRFGARDRAVRYGNEEALSRGNSAASSPALPLGSAVSNPAFRGPASPPPPQGDSRPAEASFSFGSFSDIRPPGAARPNIFLGGPCQQPAAAAASSVVRGAHAAPAPRPQQSQQQPSRFRIPDAVL